MSRLPPPRASAAWRWLLRLEYRLIRAVDPLVRRYYGARGLGDTVELVTIGRRTGRQRSVLLGLLRVAGGWYVGHPNGPVAWTRNLEAAGRGELRLRGRAPLVVRAIALGPGPERDAALEATWHQHPFPGNVAYWLARRHILAVGTYYRLEPVTAATTVTARGAAGVRG